METVLDETLAFEITKDTPSVRFIASLSDGRTVIQDDIHGQRAAWLRLTSFIKSNPHIKITCLRLQAPGNIDIAMPSNQKGYFFGNQLRAVYPPGTQVQHVGIGYYDGSKIAIRWFNTTRFQQTFTEDREKDKAGFFLIENIDD